MIFITVDDMYAIYGHAVDRLIQHSNAILPIALEAANEYLEARLLHLGYQYVERDQHVMSRFLMLLAGKIVYRELHRIGFANTDSLETDQLTRIIDMDLADIANRRLYLPGWKYVSPANIPTL